MAQGQAAKAVIADAVEENTNVWGRWAELSREMVDHPVARQWERGYQEGLDMAEKLVNEALASEERWIEFWRQTAKQENRAQEVVNRGIESWCLLMDSWVQARSQFWQSAFDSARSVGGQVQDLLAPTGDAPTSLLGTWQDISRQMMRSQTDLFRGTMGLEQDAPRKPMSVAKRASAGAREATDSKA